MQIVRTAPTSHASPGRSRIQPRAWDSGGVTGIGSRNIMASSVERRREWRVPFLGLSGFGVSYVALANASGVAMVWIGLVVGGLFVLLSRQPWVMFAVFLPALPYCYGPLYGALMDDRLWPAPTIDVYIEASVFMLASLYLAVCILCLVGFDRWMRNSVHAAIANITALAERSTAWTLSLLVCVTLGAQAWAVTLKNGLAFTGGVRRQVEHLYWMAGDITGQAMAVVSTVILLAGAARRSTVHGVVVVILLGWMWFPFAASGGRRIVIYAAVPALLIAYHWGGRAAKRMVIVGLVLGVSWFFAIPLLFPGGGNFAEGGHGEWSFAGAPLVAQVSGAMSPERLGAEGWPSNVVRALPDFAGGDRVTVFADALARDTVLFPTGTSGSPWSDLWDWGPWFAGLGLTSIILLGAAIVRMLSSHAPGVELFLVGSLTVLGRTHAPYFLSTIIVPAVFLILLRMLSVGWKRA